MKLLVPAMLLSGAIMGSLVACAITPATQVKINNAVQNAKVVCQVNTVAGPVLVAVAGASQPNSAPALATDEMYVSDVCAVINGIPAPTQSTAP